MRRKKKKAKPESRQTFGDPTAQTSALVSFFLSFQTVFCLFCFVLFECEYPFIDKSMVMLERLSITFTSNGKREFVPRDKVAPISLSFCLFHAIFYP